MLSKKEKDNKKLKMLCGFIVVVIGCGTLGWSFDYRSVMCGLVGVGIIGCAISALCLIHDDEL